MIEKHHTIPISLGGPDNYRNIMELEAYDHREVLHKTLDIPPRIYGRYTRELKMMQNDKMVLQPSTIDKMGDVQREFFHNLHKLPTRMIEEHNMVMMNLSQAERDRYYRMCKQHFDGPTQRKHRTDKFDKLHDNYIDCKKAIAQDILDTLKKHYAM